MIIPTIKLEESLWQQGYIHVAGVDEAGKGPLAGPVSAGAVVIHSKKQIVDTVRDSKLMTPLQRGKAFKKICRKSSAYGIGLVTNEEIDIIGIDMAVKKAMMIALKKAENMLGEKLDYVIVDGSKTKTLDIFTSQRILKGGLYHYSIAAGSVLAKVTRDRLMKEFDKIYPQYEFAKHVGYGTKLHMNRLEQYGPCPIHRKSYAPIRLFSL